MKPGMNALTCATLCAGALLGGCATADRVTPDDLAELQGRVEDLEETNGRLRIRLQDAEEKIFLLQDRMEATRINSARTQSLASTTITPTGRYRSQVTSSAPPPFPEVDPIRDSLPRVVLEPGAPAPQAPAPAASSEPEVVIDMDRYNREFGSSEPAWGRQPTAAATPTYRPPSSPDSGSSAAPVTASVSAPGAARAPVNDSANRPISQNAAEDGSPLGMYRAAIDQFNRADYTGAMQTLSRFVDTHPEADYMDNALFWMGECQYGLGNYPSAIEYFQRVVGEYPDGNKVPDALLKVALTHERLDNPRQAQEVLSVLVETYPTTDAASRASERLNALKP